MKKLQTIFLVLLFSTLLMSAVQANPVCGGGLSARGEVSNDLKQDLLGRYGDGL